MQRKEEFHADMAGGTRRGVGGGLEAFDEELKIAFYRVRVCSAGYKYRILVREAYGLTEHIGYGTEDVQKPLPTTGYFCRGIPVPRVNVNIRTYIQNSRVPVWEAY